MTDPVRRTPSIAAAPPNTAIPPPPPLPPSRSFFSRVVNATAAYGSRPPSAQTNRPNGGRPNPLVPRLPGIRTGYSQDASHKTGLDISALDINRDRTHAILAGKEILKTVRVQDARIVEETNLRAAVINYADRSQPRQRDGLGIHDVKWSHGQFGTHIATAAANGKVILYDLNRAGVELARLHEHTRQVHKLAFNPHQGHLLLSASHDTTVRLWDLRDMKKDIMTCNSRDQYAGINGAIYDVQWSPTDAVEFAFGTDNGTIQRWDFRHNKAPKQKITAHDQRTCTSIDWHPDGKHLLSAGVDRTVKIWDFSVNGRRQKPAYVLTTPYPVYRARWRPPYWSHEHFERGAYQCTQLATSYDRDHPVIHVWDFRRPYLPFREINKFASAPSDMLWHARDTLWTVGREGVFQQNDVHHAPKVVDRRNLQALAVSPSGELGAFAQKRPRRRRSVGLAYSEDAYLTDAREKRSSPEKGSMRSSADDSLDDSFLSSSLKRHHGRTASNRSARSFVSTPPSDTAPKVMFLTDSMLMHNETFKPNQLALSGPLPGSINVQVFAYLAQKYKAIPLPDPPTLQSFHELHHVFEQNAQYAQKAALYRLAETWRIVGASIAVATRRRANLHRDRRRHKYKSAAVAPSNVLRRLSSEQSEAHDGRLVVQTKPAESGLAALQRANPNVSAKGSSEPNLPTSPGLANPAIRALAGTTDPYHANHSSAATDSSSNVATPLARPVKAPTASANDAGKSHLPDPDHADEISLPPAVAGPHAEEKADFLIPDSANRSSTLERPSFKGPQWYKSADDLEDRRAMVGSWRAPPRVPLSLEPTDAQGINIEIPLRLERHDSDESFAMFSASTDSQRGNSMPSSFASSKSRTLESIPEKWQHPPGDSSFGKPRQGVVAGVEQADGLGKSVQISPTTIPIGKDTDGTTAQSDQAGQQGSGRSETDQPVEFGSTEKAVQDMETLHRNNQLLRHDSSESEAYASSSGGGLSVSSMADYSYDMEASGTIVPDGYEQARSPQAPKPPAHLPHATESAPAAVDPSAEDSLLLSDFQAMHVDVEGNSAFAVIGLLTNTLAFYAGSMSDAQTSSLLILLLAPLLPQVQSLSAPSDIDVAEVLTAFADTFTALGLSPTQARAILSTQLSQLISTGINPYQAEAILHTYHAQLHSLSLYNSAASLRRLAYPTYPAVYEQALKDTQIGLLCLSCKSPINNPKDKMRCESCKRAQAPCAVCWGRYPAFEPVTAKKKSKTKLRTAGRDWDHRRKRSSLFSATGMDSDDLDHPSPSVPVSTTPSKATLWTWCSLCGHGGHTNCLSTWFSAQSISDGACATEGCLCDCVHGLRREEKIRELLQHKAEKERSKVVRKGDDWKVNESKAVAAIRGTLGDSVVRDTTQTGGPTASGLTQGQGRKEEQRRVRVVEPHDDAVQQPHPPAPPFAAQQATIFGKTAK